MDIEELKKADYLSDIAAFQLFYKAALKGDVDGMERVAVMYSHGEGVVLNFDKSIEWDKKASECGSTISLNNLAITYRMKGDLRKAKHFFEKSLNSGSGDAALHLAKLYLISDKEIDKVISYLKVAINHDYICAASEEEAESLLKELER